MKIAVGADHAGYRLKEELARLLRDEGHEIEDCGTSSPESVDYPDYAEKVARAVAGKRADRGVLVCGTGIGMAISAGKIEGIRAATCNDLFTARMAREHNDANVVALGARVVGPGVAEDVVRIFTRTDFAGGRHGRRVCKIGDLE